MVFDPTFNEISREADALPDLAGDAPVVDAPDGAAEQLEGDDGILAPDGQTDAAVDRVAEGAAEEAILSGDVLENDLPPEGA